jgi:hypothetical protein
MAEIGEPEKRRESPMNQARSAYIAMLKKYDPELSQEMRALAGESFIEGWIQCERNRGDG